MKLRLRRPLAMLLTVVMLLGLLPTAAFAVEEGTGEPSTAVTPADIKLDSAECEVGDEVILDGTTTASDSGTLSYQWYQSGDDSVDEADAAEDEKNDLPLDGKTEATLTVDTAEAGTFYYYVVATNTVTLADGTTTTASTTSNVATVTVKEAEPVPPSENSEPEDDQEPTDGNASEDEQAPENGGEPTRPMANQGESYFATLTLTGFNEATDNTTFSSVTKDLLAATDDTPLKWHLGSTGTRYPATISINVGSGAPADGAVRTLTITLAKGLEFVSYPKDTASDLPEGVTLKSEPTRDEDIYTRYGYSSVYGSLVYEISAEAATKATDFSGFMLENITIQPTRAFFTEKKDGMTIEAALKVTYSADYEDGTQDVTETKSYDVALWGAASPDNVVLNSNKHSYVLSPGESVQNRPMWYFEENSIGGQLIKDLTYTIEADEELHFSDPAVTIDGVEVENNSAKIEETQTTDGRKTVTFTASNLWVNKNYTASSDVFYGNTPQYTYQVSVSESIKPGTYTYQIKNATFALESGVSITIPGNITVKFTVQEKMEEGDDTNFKVDDITIFRANIHQNEINMTMGGLAWENVGVNDTLPKTVKIQFDENAVINAVTLPQYNGITDTTINAALRMADGKVQYVSKDRSAFADKTLITLKEFGEANAVSLQSVTAQVGQLPASSTPINTAGWVVKNHSIFTQTEYFVSVGHFTSAETDSITTTYTVWTTGTGESSEGSNTKTATCTTKAVGAGEATFSIDPRTSSYPETLSPGDTLSINISFYQASKDGAYSAPMVQPVLYIRQPKDMAFSTQSLKLYDIVNGQQHSLITPESITNVTNQCTVNDGSRIWKVVLPEDYLLGYYDENLDSHALGVEYTMTVLPNASSAALDRSTMLFLTDDSNIGPNDGAYSVVSDVYNVTGKGADTKLNGLSSKVCTLMGSSQISMGSAIKTNLDENYFNYVDGDNNTIASFATGQTGSIRLNVVNNGASDAGNVVFYIPLPKSDASYSNLFGGDAVGTLDLLLTEQAGDYYTVDGGSAPNVTYATVTNYNESGLPEEATSWSDTYSDDCNMIRVTYSNIPSGSGESTITFHIKTSDDPDNSGNTSIFYPVIDCTYGNVQQRGPQAPIALQCWSGVVSGTVFDDTDRDGVQDTGESGVEGITVEVKPANAPSKYVTTDEDGKYTVTGVRTDGNVTVTVRDTIHSFNPVTGPDARQYSKAVSDPEDGSAYSVVVPIEGTPQIATYTYDANNNTNVSVSAGLIKPYTVTFNGTGNSTVNPSVIYRFPGETVGAYSQRVTVQTGAGENFQDKWSMSVNNAEATTIGDNALLSTEITGDTVFTPVIESEKNAVYFMVWDNAQGKLVPLRYEDIEYGKTLGSVTNGQFPDMSEYQRPGYTLTGWNVNGVGITIIDNDTNGRDKILNAPVTSMISYHAVYTPLSNITVTLNPNYEGAESTVLQNQSYGQPISYTAPTREGYTFLGWSTEQGATEGSMSLTCPATDTTFYAVWKPGTVRLTLLENGGTWAESSSHKSGYIDGTVGEAVTLPGESEIIREGYEFLGWYVQGDPEQKVLSDYTFPTKATTLIAKWQPKQESITFNYGEASQIESETVSGAHGTPVGNDKAEELTGKTYSGYTLTGWTAPDGTVVPAANTGSIVIEDGATYTAIWAQNQTSIIFNAGVGANFPNNGQTKTYYGNAGETLAPGDLIDPVMTGKTFEGWYTEATGGSKVETFTFPNTGSVTYYAHWKDAEYTVTFNYNGGKMGDDTSSTATVTHGQKVTDVPVPTLTGSTLQGWQNLTTGKTMTADEIKEAEVTADVIYNAVWSGNSYTVTFSNYDGDPNSVATVTVTEDAAPVAPVVKAPEGKVFLHWKDTATQQTYTAEELTKLHVKDDMDFIAEFGEDSYTITFITSSGSFEGGGMEATITKKGGEKLAADDFPTVTDSKATFTGWYYNGTTQSAEQWAGTTVSGDMSFVAAFEGMVTVSFNTMGGVWTKSGQQYANGIEGNAGETMTLPTAEHITRTGYTFTGWYTDMACTTEAPDVFPGSRTTYYAGWSTEGLSVAVTETPTYDGALKTPALTVKVGETELTAGKDYVANYENNVNAGTATVKVYGIGDYAGLTGTETFSIKKANQTVIFVKPGEQTATYGESFANTATAQLDSASAKITYSSSDTNVATVDENGTVTILKSGTVTITATAAETSNVKEGTATYELTINKANPTLTFANSTVSVKTTDTVNNPLTIVPDSLKVTYSSGTPNVATVDAATGKVTLVGEGTTTITATFAGDEKYNGATDTYTLTVDNDAIAYTAEGWYDAYDTQEHSITVKVTTPDTGAKVTYSTTEEGTYTADAPTYTDAGTYTVYFKIEAKGYDAVTGSAKVIIEKAQLTEATVTGGPYTGQQVGSVSEVKAGTLTVPEGSYEVSYVNNVDAGTAVAIITAKAGSNFVGTVPETFTITPKSLTAQMVSPIANQPYTGNKITPAVTVEDDSTTLVEGKDFTVTYGDNNSAGTNAGTVIITGTGNYAGTVTKQFDITNAGTFEVIVDNSTLTYDGKEKKPTVTVWAVSNGGNTKTLLTAATDYTVTYENNIDAGTASVTVTGTGAYTTRGDSWKSTTVYFTIQPAEQSVTFAETEVEKTYGDPAFTQAATVTLKPNASGQTPGAVTYTSNNPAVATVDSTGKVTIVGAGTATITASAAATQNYKEAKASYQLTVKPKDISSEDVKASQIPDQPYGGVPVTPDFSLTDSDLDIEKHNLEVNVDYTFTYSNNNGEGEGKITITGKGNYTGTKEVTFKIISWSESQVVVTPAAITIYMGGADGYEGAVVDEDTGEIKASSSLPEPGFLFELPEMLKAALEANDDSLTDITFREPASGKEWRAALYAEGASTVYRLVPGEHQEPVRVQFTNAQGQTVTEDEFEVGENINQTLTMTLYKGDVGVIYAIYDGVQYPIRLGESTLTVRGVTEEAQYAAVTDGTEAPAEGKPAVTAESGTTYTINGSNVQVADESGVALLYDSIIDASGEDRTGLLEDKAESAMAALNKEPANGNRFAYSFQYLDLVDTNNGNAWVKASKDVTIYWPYPAGTNQDTEFTLLHFEGLHREMDTTEIGDQIAKCKVSEVTIEEKTDTHIVLKVGSAGFSPFALVWEEKIPTYTITATSNGNGSITPAGVTTVQEGGSQSYTIKADNGYHISDVKVNGVSVGAVESYPFTNVQSNQTIAVTFSRNNSGGGGGGGGGTTRYIIEAEAGWGGDISPDGRVSVSSGSDKTFRITADEGYEIADVIVDGESVGAVSSYTFENVRKNHTISVTFTEDEPVADPDDTGVSGWLNTSDHIQYLSGYGGGKFGPTDNMTRAQAAQMFYNLLLDQDVPITVSFTDVAADAWYAKAVNTLASLGIVDGIGGNHYAPERAITRAEFTVIAMRFAHLDTSGENIFSDVTADAWYYDYVVGSIQYGWINGYEDGTFRPNNTITRSEVTAIVNRMLGRSADKAFVDLHADALTQFSDVPDSYWAYYEIMEAANAHDYTKDNGVEDWTRLQ